MSSPWAAAAAVTEALQRPARLGGSRLVCVDGPSGAGKSTLGTAMARHARGLGTSVSLVHLDDLYAGWDGLAGVGRDLLRQIVQPMAEGRPAEYARYDWHAERFDGTRTVLPADLVVLEGVGSGHPGFADKVSLLVWVETPAPLRIRRTEQRDGTATEAHMRRWRREEARLHAREDTRARADMLVDGVSGRLLRRG